MKAATILEPRSSHGHPPREEHRLTGLDTGEGVRRVPTVGLPTEDAGPSVRVGARPAGYGVYQTGEVYARSTMVIRVPWSGVVPKRLAS